MKGLYEIGQEATLEVAAISGDTVFLDLGAKSDGVLALSDVTGEDGERLVNVGDKIKVYFAGEKGDELSFTTRVSEKAAREMLEKAFENGIPVEGRVEGEIKGGYEVTVGGRRAFCPHSQMGMRREGGEEARAGKKLLFRIQEFKNDGRDIVVSNRAILEEERARKIEGLKDVLREGSVVEARVESIQTFGAFVDIGGFRALLPVSEISTGRVKDPGDFLKEGDEIKVKVVKADWEKEKVSVSLKALMADPWDGAALKYAAGTKIEGVVTRAAPYGIFVELEPGVEGLVHVSEIEDADRNTNLAQKFKAGLKAFVEVKSVDEEGRRVSLKFATSKEQDAAAERYMAGQSDGDGYNPFASLLKK